MELRNLLIKHWGYSSFRPGQEDVIQDVLNGRDVLAVMPTGGGKSICYQLPALLKEGTCVVVSPLVALMKDQVDSLKKKGIKAAYIAAFMHKRQQESILSSAIHGELKLLYISPERLQSRSFREVLMMMKISFIAVDEAHCISQWGYDFRPPYLKIAEIRALKPGLSILALTATATPIVIKDIQKQLHFKTERLISTGFERQNLTYMVIKEENKEARLLNIIGKVGGVGIVYVRSRRRTLEVAQFLSRRGTTAYYYNAGMTSTERDANQLAWIKSDNSVIVATNAFGMGIDKANVRFVVHLDIPDSIEQYFQEAGRAGRDGKPSYSVILYQESDIAKLRDFFNLSYPDIGQVRSMYNAICNYIEVPEGGGQDRSFEFDMDAFSEKYNQSPILVYSVIKLLEKQGFIMLNDGLNFPSTVMFTVGYEEIYKLRIENKTFAPLLDMLMRGYPGIFTEFVRINELYISNKLQIKDVSQKLKELERMNMILYTPSSDKPRLIFNIERIAPKYIYFDPENYQHLKLRAEERLSAVINYVITNNKCRNTMLLEYFDQITSNRCGKCDYCLTRNKASNNLVFDEVVKLLKQYNSENQVSLNEMETQLSNVSKAKIIPVLQWLLESEKITRTNLDTYFWNS